MIEIMTPQRYVALGGTVRVAEDETGILWRKAWLASDAWAAVEVINATPETNCTRKHFFLEVPANMRTAPEGGRMDLRPERERVRSPCRQNLIAGRAVTGKRLASPQRWRASSDSSATF